MESLATANNTASDPAARQRITAFDDLLPFHLPIAEESGDLLCQFIRQVAEEYIAAFIIQKIPVRMIVST